MGKKSMVFRGNIYMCDLGSGQGSEQGGTRPCLVICNDTCCRFSPVVTCVPLTSRDKSSLPTHVKVYKDEYAFLSKDSIILGEQILSISKDRIESFLGTLKTNDFDKVLECVKIQIGVD